MIYLLWQALEEVEKNFGIMRCMLVGDGETEANTEQVSQLVFEICKEDVLALLVHKLPILGWEVSYGHFSHAVWHIWNIYCARWHGVFNTGKKRFGPLLVHLIEAKGWGHFLLRTIHWEPLWVARLSCCEVSLVLFLSALLYKVKSFFYPSMCLFRFHLSLSLSLSLSVMWELVWLSLIFRVSQRECVQNATVWPV